MANLLLLDAEDKLQSDQDGIYKNQLMELLNKCRDHFAIARQGFLPPEEYNMAASMEAALDAALAIIRDYQLTKTDESLDHKTAEQNFSAMINV